MKFMNLVLSYGIPVRLTLSLNILLLSGVVSILIKGNFELNISMEGLVVAPLFSVFFFFWYILYDTHINLKPEMVI